MSEKTYLELVAAGIFAPFIKKTTIITDGEGNHAFPKAILHALFMAVIGWTVFGWFFVGRYWFTEYLRGDFDAPARIYAFENNLIFMFETIAVFLVAMWIIPALLQVVINQIGLGTSKIQIKMAFNTHAYSTSGFPFLMFPLTMILTWIDPVSWRIPFSAIGFEIMKWIFFGMIAYGFLCAAFRSHQQFGVSIALSLSHLWFPIALIVAELTLGII
jgi:hypothetical protein